MANTKFGLSQIAEQTPKWATWVFRVVLYLCAIVSLYITTYDFSPETVKEVAKICAATTVFVHGLTRMFGLTVSNDPTASNAKDQ